MDEIIVLENVKDVSNILTKYIFYEKSIYPFDYINSGEHLSKIIYNYNIYSMMGNYYNAMFFVEGVSNNNIDLTIETKSGNNSGMKFSQVIFDNKIILETLPIEEYKIYSNNSNWYKNIKKNQTMVKGELYGQVNLSSCDVSNTDLLKILCFRSDDHFLIGIYDIINGRYTIPNLDVNSRYDIVLVDPNRVIEQQVSSYRQPTKYQ